MTWFPLATILQRDIMSKCSIHKHMCMDGKESTHMHHGANTHAHPQARTLTRTHACTLTRTHMRRHVCTPGRIHAQLHARTLTRTHACTCTYSRCFGSGISSHQTLGSSGKKNSSVVPAIRYFFLPAYRSRNAETERVAPPSPSPWQNTGSCLLVECFHAPTGAHCSSCFCVLAHFVCCIASFAQSRTHAHTTTHTRTRNHTRTNTITYTFCTITHARTHTPARTHVHAITHAHTQ